MRLVKISKHVRDVQDALAAAGKGVRTAVIRLPMFVWGNGGSVFICTQLATARKLGKAYYLLPGEMCHANSLTFQLCHAKLFF